MKDWLNSWGKYLEDPDRNSNYSLNKGDKGWFSDAGMKVLRSQGRIYDEADGFIKTYVTKNDNPEGGYGYQSWDEFFTHKFQPNARPLYIPDDPKLAASLIHSACESTVLRISYKVKKHDQFWLKGQPYSLYDMLDINPGPTGVKRAEQFIGGTIYQAFLSPQDYHRWHAPVNGTIVDSYVIDGTYYAVILTQPKVGDHLRTGDPRGALIRSQPFLTIAATRAIIFIQADNPLIGLMCFVGLGMCEVSTCELSEKVKNKQKVSVGDELGMFHFGGSSHVMVFNNTASITFADNIVQDTHIKINSIIAQVHEKPPKV